MSPDERHERRLLVFCRWLSAVLDADDATRLSIEAMGRRIADGGMDGPDRKAALDQLDELLLGEVARRHR